MTCLDADKRLAVHNDLYPLMKVWNGIGLLSNLFFLYIYLKPNFLSHIYCGAWWFDDPIVWYGILDSWTQFFQHRMLLKFLSQGKIEELRQNLHGIWANSQLSCHLMILCDIALWFNPLCFQSWLSKINLVIILLWSEKPRIEHNDQVLLIIFDP